MKTEISGDPKIQCLVNRADGSELPGQAATVFAWLSKKHAVLHCHDGIMGFLLTSSGHCLLSTNFSWSN